ncbi:Uncharacterised protein [Chromobacterium violaceum]|uniref:Uncharacterized protein n=1 Tax=Chromobacterium violaceum TaxID=536 RepID=A0A447TEP2_CHRVL|nr:Uncharacterised protein [Chromobacterium violaceum]
MNVADVCAPEDLSRLNAALACGGRMQRLRLRLMDGDGRTVDCELVLTPQEESMDGAAWLLQAEDLGRGSHPVGKPPACRRSWKRWPAPSTSGAGSGTPPRSRCGGMRACAHCMASAAKKRLTGRAGGMRAPRRAGGLGQALAEELGMWPRPGGIAASWTGRDACAGSGSSPGWKGMSRPGAAGRRIMLGCRQSAGRAGRVAPRAEELQTVLDAMPAMVSYWDGNLHNVFATAHTWTGWAWRWRMSGTPSAPRDRG